MTIAELPDLMPAVLAASLLAVFTGQSGAQELVEAPTSNAGPLSANDTALVADLAASSATSSTDGSTDGLSGGPIVDESVVALREQLKLTRREHGRDAPQLIPILSDLAGAELAMGEKEYAAARLERAVELIRRHEGHYAQSLMTPLLRLANIYMSSGLFEHAISQLRYAQHLTHRRDGVYSLDQVALIEELARAFLGQDDSDEAHREMRLAFNLSRRVHGDDSVEHVPGMMRFAAWYRLIGEDRKARRLYHRSIERLEAEHGPGHYSLIEPLTHLAATASRPWYYKAEREAALLRADNILEQQPGTDAEDLAASAVRIADFYTRQRNPRKAEVHYERAWKILEASDEARLDSKQIFSAPVVLNFPHSMLPDTRRGLMIQDREVEVTYDLDVDAAGKVTRVKIVEHTGPVSLNRTLLKNAFGLRFRPQLQEGQPVATSNYRITESILLESPVSRSLFMEQLRKEMERLAVMLRVSGRVR